MVKITGSAFDLSYRRTTPYPIDSSSVFNTLEDATVYARNTDTEVYVPYAGQIISVLENGKIYTLVKDTTIPETDGRKHFKLDAVVTGESADGNYLRKDQPDTAQGTITFINGLIANAIKSKDFTTGTLGKGFALFTDDSGSTHAEVDELIVRKRAQFVELVIEKLSHIGGQVILSPASITCIKVEELSNAYRCYFNYESETTTFVVGDQARAQTFGTLSGNYYWRLVTAVSSNYIDLSKTDCDSGSGVPRTGDEICQLGNRTDTTRQNAIILSSYGDDSPFIKQYSGINDYVLSGKEKQVISPFMNKFTGEFHFNSNKNIETELESAKEDAKNAQSKAETAKSVADSAKERLNSWAADGVISPTEKKGINDEIVRIDADKNDVTNNYSKYNLGNPVEYNTAYSMYRGQLILLSVSVPENITIPADFTANQIAYYAKRTSALNSIAIAAKKIADDAQAKANQASADALNAQARADEAVGKANEASNRLNNWASDSIISPVEKLALKQEQTQITAEKDKIVSDAVKYGVDSNAYINAFNGYNSELSYHSTSIPENIPVRASFATIQSAYYAAYKTILNDISTAAKRYVDTSAEGVKEAVSTGITIVPGAIKVFGKEISIAGMITFSSLSASEQQNFKGNTGDQGPRGYTGEQGPRGYTGYTGATGPQGPAGFLDEVSLNNLKNDFAKNIGYSSYQDMSNAATNKQTIIEGGFIKSSLIQADAIFAQKIASVSITTGNITVTDGAKIAGFKVNGNKLESIEANGSITIGGDSGVRFFSVNSYGSGGPFLRVRDDFGGGCLSLTSKFSSLQLCASSGGMDYAISGGGNCKVYQRVGDIWHMPGVLFAGIWMNSGGLVMSWGQGAGTVSVSKKGTGEYRINHGIYHDQYTVIANQIGGNAVQGFWMSASFSLTERYTSSCVVISRSGTDLRDVEGFSFAIIGRNTIST